VKCSYIIPILFSLIDNTYYIKQSSVLNEAFLEANGIS